MELILEHGQPVVYASCTFTHKIPHSSVNHVYLLSITMKIFKPYIFVCFCHISISIIQFDLFIYLSYMSYPICREKYSAIYPVCNITVTLCEAQTVV